MSAWEQYHSELREMHLAAGLPTMREIARRTGQAVSHATVHAYIRGERLPPWDSLRAVVKALGGDEEAFHDLWVTACRELRSADTPAAPPLGDQAMVLGELTAIRQLLEQILARIEAE